MKPGNRGPISGLMARVEGGAGYAAAKETQNVFGVIAQSNVFGLVAKMAGNTEKWYHYVALGSKPLSALGVLTEERNKRLKDEIGFLQQEKMLMAETYRSQAKSLSDQRKQYEVRYAQLYMNTKRTTEESRELGKLGDIMDKFRIKEEKALIQVGNIEALQEERQQRRINKMNPAYLAQLNKELIERKQGFEADNAGLRTHLKDLYQQDKMVKLEATALKLKKDALYAIGDTGGEYQKIVKRLQEIRGEESQIAGLRTQELDKLMQQRKEITTIDKQMQQIATTGRGGGGVPMWSSGIHKLNEFVKSAFNSVGNKITGVFEKAGNSLKAVGSVLAQRLNPINIVKGLIGKSREDREGAGALGSALGKVASIALKILVALGLMEPVQRLIGIILKAVKPVMDSLIAILFPAIKQIIIGLLPLIQVLIKFLLPPLLKILGLALIVIGTLIKVIQAAIGAFTGRDNEFYKAIGSVADGLLDAGGEIMKSNNKLNTTLGKTNDTLDRQGTGTPGIVSTGPRGSLRIIKPGMGGSAEINADENAATTAEATQTTAKVSAAQLAEQQKTNDKMDALIASIKSIAPAGYTPAEIQQKNNDAAVQGATSGATFYKFGYGSYIGKK
jgi:methyl-accepting chemotaxis protein